MVNPIIKSNSEVLHPEFTSFIFDDDGTFPNNSNLAVILYHQAFNRSEYQNPSIIESRFNLHGWVNSWRNGLYNIHHYHSTAHEVLGIYQGWVEAQLGGPDGKKLKVTAGDVIVIPAGVAHKNINQSPDFSVIGAYPLGQSWDMNTGKSSERPDADSRIRQVALPEADPVFGKKGPLVDLWKV